MIPIEKLNELPEEIKSYIFVNVFFIRKKRFFKILM